MLVRRLTWAGLEIETPAATAVIDLLARTPSLSEFAGPPREELLAPSAQPGTVAVAAVTHLHSDHYDVESLRLALAADAPILCPAAAAETVRDAGFNARGVELWETVTVDGFGSPQVSWVVADADRRLIHCGDTLWHGYWWQIAKRCGPFDLAFLPINAAVAEFEYTQPPSGVPAVLTPEQAAAAAQVLQARAAVPIHYGTFHQPPLYIAVPEAESSFVLAAERRGVDVRLPRPGEVIDLTPSPA